MSTVAPPAKVLVTGANGFIAMWIIRTLLEKGYRVRGTVRSAEKGKHVEKTFKEHGDRLELVVVEDYTKEGAFDEAVQGVDAIEHTASPVTLKVDHPDEIVGPAVAATVGILKSALTHGKSVKRIVVTSSCAAILRVSAPLETTYSEADWNTEAVDAIRTQVRAASPLNKYCASKTLAEQSAWAFVEEHKGELGWDLVVINPPYVFGPFIHATEGRSPANEALIEWYDAVLSGAASTPGKLRLGNAWVDVRDLADAHRLALEKSEAGGGRIIVSAGSFLWQDWLDIANALTPPPLGAHVLPKGVAGYGRSPEAKFVLKYDTSKAARVLGVTYRSAEETTRDLLDEYVAKGWLE
ncbi:hypothetical protein PLICRDRAFT_114413 [Plicaturopsis crispa FD-325 SS-3]|nr:hypothetical protein PLICRDRAFT_114413 [Plicaturopsis crispa FD-325 SS-3]